MVALMRKEVKGIWSVSKEIFVSRVQSFELNIRLKRWSAQFSKVSFKFSRQEVSISLVLYMNASRV